MNTKLNKDFFKLTEKIFSKTIGGELISINPLNDCETIKIPEHWLIKKFDNRIVSNETINWKKIKKGDVVIQGNILNDKTMYITLTNVDGKYWEYFENGYYKSTSPEFCHWLVKGQKHCDGKLIKIEND